MERRYQAQLLMLQTAQGFLNTHQALLGQVNVSPARVMFDDAVAALSRLAAEQIAANTQRTSRTELQKVQRAELRINHMQPIARIAESQIADTQVIAKLKLPRMRTDDRTLISNGNAMARMAAKHEQLFIDQQLPPTFIADLKASIDAVKSTRAAREGDRMMLKAATAGILKELARAKKALRVLDSLVLKQLASNSDLLSAWRQGIRVKAKPGPKAQQPDVSQEAAS